jgi:hypothetical protein
MRNILTIVAAILVGGWALAATAQTGDGAGKSGDNKELATQPQHKPAHEPQQTVPGPTPQETSKKTDGDKFVTGKDQSQSQESSGSSAGGDTKKERAAE